MSILIIAITTSLINEKCAQIDVNLLEKILNEVKK